MFWGVVPRVDKNTENRGPHFWLKATHHGHFYVWVEKVGTLRSASNYPPFTGVWVPDAHWVVALWRQHKLGHDDYMKLSVKLRDGHDRRRACMEAVVASEKKYTIAEEMKLAKQLILSTARPFKPLQDKIQKWRLQYTESHTRVATLDDVKQLAGRR
jgi:hypothetical protein